MFNKVILIGRPRTERGSQKLHQNNNEYVVLNIANPGKLEERQRRLRNPHRMASRLMPGGISRSSPKPSIKGQFVHPGRHSRYREVEDEVKGTTFKHRIAEIHAISMKRLSKVEALMILRTELTTSSRQKAFGG